MDYRWLPESSLLAIRIKLFGQKIVERAGPWRYTWYIYRDKVYLADIGR